MVEYTKVLYTSNGNFVVPAGVTRVRVSLCGGGGPTTYVVNDTSETGMHLDPQYAQGGASSFGNLITASGGQLFKGGGLISGDCSWIVDYGAGASQTFDISTGETPNDFITLPGGKYGNDGSRQYIYGVLMSSGGSGQFKVGQYFNVVGGESIPVIVGVAGARKLGNMYGWEPSGTPGAVQIEYGGEIEPLEIIIPGVFSEKVIVNTDIGDMINKVDVMSKAANPIKLGKEFPLPDNTNKPVMMEHFHDLAKCINVLEEISNNNCNCKQGTTKCQSCQSVTCQSCQYA